MKFRKKPVVIDAFQWDGSLKTAMAMAPFENATLAPEILEDRRLAIHTLEGTMTAEVGDWVIKGVKGEIYPCKPDIFEQTYEKVEQ